MRIGIIGNGFVGRATGLFACEKVRVYKYDILPHNCEPPGLTLKDVESCDLIFVCVPTPLSCTGACDTGIVDQVLAQINHQYIVVRSTVPVGYCSTKDCFFMPEFLTELNWKNDFVRNAHWIIGMPPTVTDETRNERMVALIRDLIRSAHAAKKIDHDHTIFCTTEEAELTKLIRNTFLATKVSFFNEIYDLVRALNISYERVQELVALDTRIGSSHLKVPSTSTPGGLVKRGFGGTCLPKDTNSLFSLFMKNNVNSLLIERTLYRNEYHDRRERDWISDYGRACFDSSACQIWLICDEGDNDDDDCEYIRSHFLERPKSTQATVLYHGHRLRDLPGAENVIPVCVQLTKKLFFPRIDKIYYCNRATLDARDYLLMRDQILSMINLIELAELHQCPFEFRGNSLCQALYDAYRVTTMTISCVETPMRHEDIAQNH